MDAKGAEQLIGMGDMLISTGSDLTRLQCAFIDTPEVERICDFIGSQRAYPQAHILPEYEGEGEVVGTTADLNDKDALLMKLLEQWFNHNQVHFFNSKGNYV